MTSDAGSPSADPGPKPPAGPFLSPGIDSAEKHAVAVSLAGANAPGWRGYAALWFTLLVIKAAALGWGVYAGLYGELNRRDYLNHYHHHRLIGRWDEPPRFDFFELWVASDAQWYLAIAEDGYPRQTEFNVGRRGRRPKMIAAVDTDLKYAFFPIWPMVIRATRHVVADVNAAGFVSANVLSFAALTVLYGFLGARAGARAAFWTVVLLAASPFALFLHVPFTESLFLLLAVSTFAACERRWWLLAGTLVGLAMVARPNGIALAVVPLVWYAIDGRGPGARSKPTPSDLCWLLAAAVPLGAFMGLAAWNTGDPLYFARATDWWGYDQGTPLHNLWHNTVQTLTAFPALPWHGFHQSKVDFLVLVISLTVLVIGLPVLPGHYSAYAAGIILVPLLTKDLMSFSRYALLAWPLFHVPVLLTRAEHRRWVFGLLAMLSLLVQMAHMGAFVNWRWVG